MGKFISMEWNNMNCQQLFKSFVEAKLSGEIKNKDYIINSVDKISLIESKNGQKINIMYRLYGLVKPLEYIFECKEYDLLLAILDRKYDNKKIPLLTTSFIVIMEKILEHIIFNNKNQNEYSIVEKMFSKIKLLLFQYRDDDLWKNKIMLMNNKKFRYIEQNEIIREYLGYIYAYRINLILLYRNTNDIEEKYMDKLFYYGISEIVEKLFSSQEL